MDKYNLVYENEEWKLKKEKLKKAIKVFETKEDGKDFSTNYVKEKSGSLKIRKKDNTIQEERTYPKKNDPIQSEG